MGERSKKLTQSNSVSDSENNWQKNTFNSIAGFRLIKDSSEIN